ncbi:cytochrome c biogenesis protein ResB [Nakamurella silvestris]|nr:cytochrome c biogenesis protein ResB [Nakamurella silvestris]
MSKRDVTHLHGDDPLDEVPAEVWKPARGQKVLAFLRNIWRQLTSMRVALVLLFLLALASLPGALLPQWSLNRVKTAQYILDHPTMGPILDDLGFFAVFGSPWYAAIYLLLFISLIGCLTPRTFEFIRQLRAVPVLTPRNLARMPHHEKVEASPGLPPVEVADRVEAGLRRWRKVRRSEGDTLTISAEKGYLREVGNLVFHISLVGILVAIAVGKLVGYEGNVVVRLGEDTCLTAASYDDFRPGLLIDGTELKPICVTVDSFDATYTDAGIATAFTIKFRYQLDEDLNTGNWRNGQVQINEPMRFDGERLYLLGHGFAPKFQVTYPNGEVRDYIQNFQPTDPMLLSEGAVKIPDPPVEGEKKQLALVGIFAPDTFVHAGILTSIFPAPNNPGVAIQVYQGDLGPSYSVYQVNQDQIDNGALADRGRANLLPGESMTIEDGTKITFTGYEQWVSLQVSYDPAQGFALIFAITMIAGLMLSLTIKRRRVWYRISPGADGARTVVEVGGLARTDQAGYGSEFSSMVALVPGAPGSTDVPAERADSFYAT